MTSPDPTRLTSDERGDLIDVVYGALLSDHLIGNVLIPVVERILAARLAAARADAWAEGHRAGCENAGVLAESRHRNPYPKGQNQ